MALEIDWREPPPSPEVRLKAELKKNPGRWARVKINMASSTSAPAWRKEGFEAQAHLVEGSSPKNYDIYARWPLASPPATQPSTGSQTPGATPAKESAATSKPKPPASTDDTDLHIPTSGDVTGGYLASRANRGVPAEGAHAIRLAGPTASPVRP